MTDRAAGRDSAAFAFTDIQPDSAAGRGDAGSSGNDAASDSNDRNGRRCCPGTRQACQDCLSTLCCGACIGSVLCCYAMEPTTRIKYLWGWLCVLSVATGIIFSVAMYGTGHSSPSPTDMRVITHKISSIFCSKLMINSKSVITTYSFDEAPQIDSFSSETYSTDLKTTFRNDYIYWRFYLLRGSQVELRSCSEADVWIYVIAGAANWERWSKNMLCHHCFLHKRLLTKTHCSGSDVADVFTFMVNRTNDYFIVYRRTSDAAFLRVKLSLDRTLYDVTKATRLCTNDESACEYALQYSRTPYIVYHMGAGPYGKNAGLDTVCEPRIWIYFVIFFMGPFMIGAVLSIIVNKQWGETSTTSSTSRYNAHDDERAYLLGSDRAVHPRYSSIPQPPKYEDIEPNRHSPPPSYEAAMRQTRTQ
ncbi:E3 ubiquitin-protein ligase APD2-like [Haliotis rubra]|uniref:E3 ubiquitin-protein ligase APD2-like n=1 Tax=Haliotis rubra TaxID=36100 RepID=UPI001EE5EEAE|nr:E3 ubiquitin-protein ligase APD2-like [Haliotis rubra]